MPIIGFNMTKINAEKKGAPKGSINVNANAQAKNVKETKMKMPKKQKALEIEFHYTAKYEPKVGKIDIEGNITLLEETKNADNILKEWKKNKKLPNNYFRPIINTVLSRCSVEAVIISRDVNLPPPVQMPKVIQSKKDNSYVG
jgi:hypothetical protein